ncbi:response regulator transcription factor [Lachnoclostridium sp. An169]|uniref:response regulator transcription factor n=1 Tax=Lachnoclostridium sp. An169 TaxID=1965569 RepID=UPI000B366EC1|nr:response regulator transcription factor [Lachnoclostridium sp. An169]
MNKILIIEDDTDINNMTAEALKKAGYESTQAFSGTEGLLYIEREPFSLVIMDLMLPGLNGEDLLPKIRAKQDIPVIVISAKDSIDSKVNLLTSGAEDYLTKPFDIQELIARVGVQIRRFARDLSGSGSPEADVLTFKEMELHMDSYSVSVCGKPLDLTRQEFKILELLLLHPNKVFSKQDIYDYAWDDIYIGEDKTINVHISNIRKKLKAVTEEEYIETVWGIGFRLKK